MGVWFEEHQRHVQKANKSLKADPNTSKLPLLPCGNGRSSRYCYLCFVGVLLTLTGFIPVGTRAPGQLNPLQPPQGGIKCSEDIYYKRAVVRGALMLSSRTSLVMTGEPVTSAAPY